MRTCKWLSRDTVQQHCRNKFARVLRSQYKHVCTCCYVYWKGYTPESSRVRKYCFVVLPQSQAIIFPQARYIRMRLVYWTLLLHLSLICCVIVSCIMRRKVWPQVHAIFVVRAYNFPYPALSCSYYMQLRMSLIVNDNSRPMEFRRHCKAWTTWFRSQVSVCSCLTRVCSTLCDLTVYRLL